MTDDRLVTIAKYRLPHHAHMLRVHLKGVGIEAVILDEHSALHFAHIGGAAAAVRVQVRASDLPQLRDLLGLDADSEEGPLCPRCGSPEVEFVKVRGLPRVVSLLVRARRIPLTRRRWRCGRCRHGWRD